MLKRYLWVLALFAALAYAGTDSWTRLRSIWVLTQVRVADSPVPALDPTSSTGYALGQRNLILPHNGMDGFHWIMQAQLSLAGEGPRIRKVDYDNPPAGREVHWSSSFRWWLIAVAWLDHLVTGEPMPIAVESVAPFANTVLLGLFMLSLTPLVAWRLGSVPASLLVVGMVSVQPFYQLFVVGNPDHHGLAAISGLMTVLFLIGGGGGWVKSEPAAPVGRSKARPVPPSALALWLPDLAAARRWFIASGVAGGAGLWVSAATVAPVLIGTGLGALGATGVLARSPRPTDAWRAEPRLWRVWGIAGAGSSLFFYVLEYFPAHLGWRLEVNHPLYALAWLGAGELLYQVCRSVRGEQRRGSRRDWLAVAFSVLAIAALPVVISLWPARTFWVSDRFLWDFHEDYIVEFRGLIRFLEPLPARTRLAQANILPLLAIPTGYAVLRTKLAAPAKGLLTLALLPSLTTLVLPFAQVRWLGLAYGIWLAALAAIAMVLSREPWLLQRLWARVGAGLFVTAVLLVAPLNNLGLWLQFHWVAPTEWEEVVEIVTRDVAHRLRTSLGDAPGLVVSGPTTTTWLIYYGGFRGLGTLYWENLPGLKATAQIYSAPSQERAYEAIKKHGVTHLVIFSWDAFAREYARLSRGMRLGQEPPVDAFLLRLLGPSPPRPAWLRELPYAVPQAAGLKGHWVRIYEVNTSH